MPSKSKQAKRLGATSSFDSFRVSKPAPKVALKNAKAQIARADSSDDIKISLQTSSSLDSSNLVEVLDVKTSDVAIPDEPKPVLPQLDEQDDDYVQAAEAIRSAKKTPALHTKPNTIETILRDFDLTGKYGPCVGISRLDRYKRAVKMKMNPPPEIEKILLTQQAQERDEYKHDLFYGRL